MNWKHTYLTAGLLLAACTGSPPELTESPTIEVNPNERVPQAAIVRFAADRPVQTLLTVSDGEQEWQLHYGEDRNPATGLPVVGLAAGREHEIQIRIEDANGRTAEASAALSFTAPALPQDRESFPPIQVTVNKSDQLEPGYVFFNPRRRRVGQPSFGAGFGMLLITGYDGTVRWYYRGDSRISDFEVFQNGNIFFITQDYRLVEIDWLGNTVNQWYAAGRPEGEVDDAIAVDTLTFHHEVDELPNGNIVILGSEIREIENYYTSEYDQNAPRKRQQVMGDVIVEFDRETGETVWEWNAFDYMDPYRIGYETFSGYWERRGFPGVLDWSHANNLLYDSSDDSLIINFRYQAAAMKIDRATKQIKWILGEPGGWGDLSGKLLEPVGDLQWPYHQHAPNPTPNGTVLIFDNGNYRARPFTPPLPPSETYTRAVEYKIDESAMTIEQVWQSEQPGEDSVVSFAMGDVDWLPETGNILVAYGFVMDPDDIRSGRFNWKNAVTLESWTRLRQYGHTDPPELLWEMVLDDDAENPVSWALFGAELLPGWTKGSTR